jgi:hypothetical protein
VKRIRKLQTADGKFFKNVFNVTDICAPGITATKRTGPVIFKYVKSILQLDIRPHANITQVVISTHVGQKQERRMFSAGASRMSIVLCPVAEVAITPGSEAIILPDTIAAVTRKYGLTPFLAEVSSAGMAGKLPLLLHRLTVLSP